MICSSARPVRNGAAPETNGIRPPLASPAPTPTMFCSAIPTLISRSGNAFWKAPSLLEPTLSLTTATIRSSSRRELDQRALERVAAVEALASCQLLQRLRGLLGVGDLVVPLDAVLDERHAAALDRVWRSRSSGDRARTAARRSVSSSASTSLPSTVRTAQPNASNFASSGSSALVSSVRAPCCRRLRSTITVRLSRPRWPAAMIASQLEPSCSSPSPTRTNVRRGEPSSLAAIAVPTADRQPVPERAGVGLHARHLVAVRVAVERRPVGHVGVQQASGMKPAAASVV